MFEVLGIGNAIVDILATVDDEFLSKHALLKSNMQLTSVEKQNEILQDLRDLTEASGGSVANTIATLSALGNSSAFVGQVSDDKWGNFFEKDMKDIGVTTDLNIVKSNGSQSSGTSIILITPDGERTMNTHLGVSSQIDVHCVDSKLVNDSKIIYLEGYLYDSPEAMEAIDFVVEIAKKNNAKIALSLSDSFCVDRHRSEFKTLIKTIDILFANEAEFASLFEIKEDEKIEFESYINDLPATVAVTKSERGCALIDASSVTHIKTTAIDVPVDLTGAGDQFAAGFLHKIAAGDTAQSACEFGMQLASKIILKIGPRFSTSEIDNIA